MRHTIPLLLSFLFVSPIVSKGQEKPLDLAGVYTIKALDETYTGTATIKKNNAVYELVWRLDNGVVFRGVGISSGKTLSVSWSSASRIQGTVEAPGVQLVPRSLTGYQNQIGKSFVFNVTGSNIGPVWGGDDYTSDSYLATAAVHAGILRPGQRGAVKVTITKGLDKYTGSTRNGIKSSSWGAFPFGYRIEKSEAVVNKKPAQPLVVGSVVKAKWRGVAFFPGKIAKVNADSTYAVRYDDGDFEASVKRDLIVPMGKINQLGRVTQGSVSGAVTGIVVYQIGPKGRVLTGSYAVTGKNVVFREILTRTN